KDNVQVGVDAVLYMQVLDPHLASYGITNYAFAIAQLAQTTLRSEIGKIELDRTFEARGIINANVVAELDKASVAWGVKVMRYEIKNIAPPKDVLSAMEKQMRAEREKRAVVLASEGERDAKINQAEGDKQRVIKASEANKQQQINEAEGQSAAILAVATATAEGLRRVGSALSDRGGMEAMQLRVGEEYVRQFGKLAKESTTLVVPGNLSDLASVVTMATSIVRKAAPPLADGKGAGRQRARGWAGRSKRLAPQCLVGLMQPGISVRPIRQGLREGAGTLVILARAARVSGLCQRLRQRQQVRRILRSKRRCAPRGRQACLGIARTQRPAGRPDQHQGRHARRPRRVIVRIHGLGTCQALQHRLEQPPRPRRMCPRVQTQSKRASVETGRGSWLALEAGRRVAARRGRQFIADLRVGLVVA